MTTTSSPIWVEPLVEFGREFFRPTQPTPLCAADHDLQRDRVVAIERVLNAQFSGRLRLRILPSADPFSAEQVVERFVAAAKQSPGFAWYINALMESGKLREIEIKGGHHDIERLNSLDGVLTVEVVAAKTASPDPWMRYLHRGTVEFLDAVLFTIVEEAGERGDPLYFELAQEVRRIDRNLTAEEVFVANAKRFWLGGAAFTEGYPCTDRIADLVVRLIGVSTLFR